VGKPVEVEGINPRVLQWARERAGYSLEDAAQKMGKAADVLVAWECGEGAPTYAQLEKLAYSVYKRPIALFFFPEPPPELDATKEFRTLPEFEISELSSHTRYMLRQAQAMQLALRELNDGHNPAPAPLFRELTVRRGDAPDRVAAQLRKALGVDFQTQQSWDDEGTALKEWRNRIEERGIFIFKNSFKQRDVSGFCLLDEEVPVIYLNNSTTWTRQIFTIFHELGHILLHSSGVTKQDDSYVDSLRGTVRQVEMFANQFAAEFLVPSAHLERALTRGWNETTLADLADTYHVSREVILRNLLDRGLVSPEEYRERASKWAQEFKGTHRRRGKGGDYYNTRSSYLGSNYLQLAFNKYYQGRISREQLADYLGVKIRNVRGLEEVATRGAGE